MKLPSTLQSPHELYPSLPMSRSPAPVLLYDPGEKRGEVLPIPHPHALTELPQRHRCPLRLRAHTLEAEKPENGPGHRTISHHTAHWLGAHPQFVWCFVSHAFAVLSLDWMPLNSEVGLTQSETGVLGWGEKGSRERVSTRGTPRPACPHQDVCLRDSLPTTASCTPSTLTAHQS